MAEPSTPVPSPVDDDLRDRIAVAIAEYDPRMVGFERGLADVALSVVSPLLAERDAEGWEHYGYLLSHLAAVLGLPVPGSPQEPDHSYVHMMESVALLRWLHAEACWQRDQARQAIAAITTGGRPADTIPAPDADTTAFLRARWERRRAHPRCTGISSDALAWYAAGAPEPAKGDYPSDPDDLAACWRTYTMAPLRLRLRMLPVLRLYSDWVAERYPEQVAALLVEFEPADPTDEPTEQTEGGWRPMRTAPRDGTQVEVRWDNDPTAKRPATWEGSGWVRRTPTSLVWFLTQPDAWRPMPEASVPKPCTDPEVSP